MKLFRAFFDLKVLGQSLGRSLGLGFGLVVLAGVVFSEEAYAQYAFSPTISVHSEKVTDLSPSPLSDQDRRIAVIDFRFGRLFNITASQIFLGAIYKFEDETFSEGDMRGFLLGPSLGWSKNAMSAMFTYHLMGQRRYSYLGSEIKYTNGHGVQLDFAYTPEVLPRFGLGPQISYRSITYDKSQVSTLPAASQPYETSGLSMALALWWGF